jgi:stalled ribosome rescue protein Dom34
VALSAATSGWAGVGLGSQRMDGAFIYMGFVKDGTAVFSEQLGKAHRHTPVKDKTTDKNAVTLTKGVTVVEFHIPADRLPVKGKTIAFIVAQSHEANLTTFHEDSSDTGTFTLP